MNQPHEKSKLSTQKELFGGYDCDFVHPPPYYAFQMECPICHLILREPFLVRCCGTSFCHICIQQQGDESSCLKCGEDNVEVFPNKGLQRSLKQLYIYCTHKKDGCLWRGELGELDQHVNVSQEY